MSLKSRVEAVLFLTDKPVVAAVVAKLVNEDVQLVRQAILELIHDYEERNSALEIADDDDGYMMQVKDQYANLANNLAPIDLPVSSVRTLSAIAIKQPVLQSEIVRIRGAGAYEHIKDLLEKDLITKKEEGRSSLLSTTKKFQEYFRLSQDAKALRYQLKDNAKEATAGDSEIPAEQQLQLHLDGEPVIIAAQAQTMEAQTAGEPVLDAEQEAIIHDATAEEVFFKEETAQEESPDTQVIESEDSQEETPTELSQTVVQQESTQLEPADPIDQPSGQTEFAEESEPEGQVEFSKPSGSSKQEDTFDENSIVANSSQPGFSSKLIV